VDGLALARSVLKNLPVDTGTKQPTFLSRFPAATSAARGVSWLALVAATGLGIYQVGRVRAEISADAVIGTEADGEGYRLIVQSYTPESVGDDSLPTAHARPLASTQRAITAEELKKGVEVDIVQLGAETSPSTSIVVAWIERGAPDLELDALTARPTAGALYGAGAQDTASARVVLRRRPA
jgi:hypothetical protein